MITIRLLSAIAAAGLLLTLPRAVLAEGPQPPLEPGHSAGVHAAQKTHTGLALIGTAAIIAVVFVATTTSNGGGNNNQPNSLAAPATTAP
jgi:hypothetical protein